MGSNHCDKEGIDQSNNLSALDSVETQIWQSVDKFQTRSMAYAPFAYVKEPARSILVKFDHCFKWQVACEQLIYPISYAGHRLFRLYVKLLGPHYLVRSSGVYCRYDFPVVRRTNSSADVVVHFLLFE
jgi:hypothetical protein